MKHTTKEFRALKVETRTEHMRHVKSAGDFNNNKTERMNGELRQREKVMRTLKKPDTPILSSSVHGRAVVKESPSWVSTW
jgi:hypothetical protein